MPVYCKGLCDRYPQFHRYEDGFRFCARCSVFMQVEGNMCPCCHMQLRNTRINQRLSHRTKLKRY